MFLNKYISLQTPEGNINIDIGTAIAMFSHKIKHNRYDYLFNKNKNVNITPSPIRDKYQAPPSVLQCKEYKLHNPSKSKLSNIRTKKSTKRITKNA